MQEQAEPRHRGPRSALGHRVPGGGKIRSSSKLTVSMSLRYLGIGLRARVEQPVTTPARHKRVPACRGACANVTSGAPACSRRSSGPEVALRVCGCRGRAVPGARLEGGLGKGECPRAATATVPVAAGELAASLPRHPAAPRALTPRSGICGS